MSAKAGILESLDNEPVSMYYVDEYNDFLWADGQYNDYKKAITVKKNSESQNVILAHEYLHYVWFSGDLDSNQDLVNNLQAFYNRTSSLQTRMEPYPKDMVKPFLIKSWRILRAVLEECVPLERLVVKIN